MPSKPHRIIREGIIAGIIGASAVAIWFLIVDTIAGQPLLTPRSLGYALFSTFGPIPEGESPVIHIIFYTIFHYAAFSVAGIVLSVVVHVAQREPTVLAGALILFVAFEIGFHAFVQLLQETVLGVLAWYNVMIGNLLAAGLMGFYLWKRHPELKLGFSHALDGQDHTGEHEVPVEEEPGVKTKV